MDFNEIINSDKPTLVDFYADWCGPCKVMSPIIEETKKDLGADATVLKVNIDPELGGTKRNKAIYSALYS